MKKKRAFTLIELAVVIVIMGILTLGVTQGAGIIRASRLANARSFTSKSIVPNISGLIAWYETSSKDSFKVTETGDGAQLTEWYDISPSSIPGKKNKLTRTASSAVTYKSIGINKIPSVNFNGSGNFALTSFYQGTSAQHTIFIVANPAALSGAMIDSGPSQAVSAVSFNTTGLNLNCGAASQNLNSTPSPVTNTDYIIAAYLNGSNSKAFFNSATVLLSGSGNPGSNTLVGATIGTDRNGSSGFSGMISEIIIYNRPLQVQERRDIVRYLSKKYNIAVSGL